MKFQNTLVSNIRGRSQRYFAHVTTVSLSWRVQNIVVISRVYLKLERSEFSSNFEFDRNMLSGTGAISYGTWIYAVTWWHGNAFRITGSLWGLGSDAGLSCCLWLNNFATNSPVVGGFRCLTVYVIHCYENDSIDNLPIYWSLREAHL